MRVVSVVAGLLLSGASQAAIVSDNSITGTTVNDFNAFVSGNVVDTISQTGATYGEAFAGQTVSSDVNGYDTLSGSPTVPLTLTAAASAADNIGIAPFGGGQVIRGDSGGGAVSILFDAATDVFGLEVVGDDSGAFTVDFFGTSGGLLGSVTQSTSDGFFGFSSTGTDILGVSITNTDVGGLGYDNVTFNSAVAPIPLPAGLPLLLAGLGGLALLRRRS